MVILRESKKNILKVPYWSQSKSDNTCGPICIRMVLSYLRGRRLNEREYFQLLDLTMNGNPQNRRGTSKQTMKSVIKKLDFRYNNIYGEKGLDKALNRRHPVIAKCLMYDEYGDRYKHYVVITGQDDEHFYINDPYADRPGRILKKIFLSRAEKLNWGYKQWGIEAYKK